MKKINFANKGIEKHLDNINGIEIEKTRSPTSEIGMYSIDIMITYPDTRSDTLMVASYESKGQRNHDFGQLHKLYSRN